MGNHGRMELRLTAADYNLILQSVELSPATATALRASLVDGMFLRFTMPAEVCGELLTDVMNAALAATVPARRRTLERLVRHLTTALVGAGGQFEIDPLAVIRSADSYNRRAREDLGGLSPQAIHRLLGGDWRAGTSGLQLREDAPAELLATSPVLHNARAFLTALLPAGTEATAKGNLNRAFVAEVLAAGRWRDGFLEDLHRFNKVINEDDAWPVHELRVVLELGRLIARRKGRFRATRRGRDLAAVSRAGELLALLFETMFGTFNLAYRDRLPELPAFQDTVGFSLAVLARQPSGWLDYDELISRLLLPAIAEQMPAGGFLDVRYALVTWRLVERLRDFGLVEVAMAPEEPRRPSRIARLRRTPLFDRFLAVTLD